MKNFNPTIRHLIPLLILAGISSCSLLEDEPKNDEKENFDQFDVYEQQAQNAVFDTWENMVANTTGDGRLATDDSIDTTSFCEIPMTMRRFNYNTKLLIITFNSFRCEPPNIVRTGSISLEQISGIDPFVKDAVVKITYQDFRITDELTGKYVEYNGERYITNLTGGRLKDHTRRDPEIVHRVRSKNFRANYNGYGEVIKNTARLKVLDKIYDLGLGGYRMTIYGDTTIAGMNNVADWGTLQNGKTFYHIIQEPIIYQNCERYCRYVDGMRVRKVIDGRETFTEFGVARDGKEYFNTCLSYGKLVWYYDNGDSIAAVIPHP